MYATQANDIYVNLYIQSEAEIETEGGKVGIKQTTDYPWEGAVTLEVNPETAHNFALRLRIPGWSQDAPVPTDLYHFTDKANPYVVMVNGKKIKPAFSSKDGYFTIVRDWQAGDKISFELSMDVRQIEANPNAEDDLGKLAVQRGPIVYCLEGVDQKDSIVFNKIIPQGTAFTPSFEKDLLGGVVTLQATSPVSLPAFPFTCMLHRPTTST